jgi:hypothetical protein
MSFNKLVIYLISILGGLQRSIEQARGEVEMLNITITQKQEAITVLIDLLNKGVTESQIVQLTNFAGEWNKYWQSSTCLI